jgi:hypothetical protein
VIADPQTTGDRAPSWARQLGDGPEFDPAIERLIEVSRVLGCAYTTGRA